MKVTNNATHNASTAQEAKINEKANAPAKTAHSPRSEPSVGGASVEISDRARLLQKATEVAVGAPETQSERVAALKKSISEGKYRVNSAAVAENLVNEHLSSDYGKNNI